MRWVVSDARVLPGTQVLWRNGVVVWCGALDAPTEDVDCDKITLNPKDYEDLRGVTKPAGKT